MQKAENVQVQLFPTRGYHMTTIKKLRVPMDVVVKLVQLTRLYGKSGLLSAVYTQLFMYGYDYVEKTFGVEKLVSEVYKMRKKWKKGGGVPPNGESEAG
jgi:hypothetical protein